jgi:hypothetical protein
VGFLLSEIVSRYILLLYHWAERNNVVQIVFVKFVLYNLSFVPSPLWDVGIHGDTHVTL